MVTQHAGQREEFLGFLFGKLLCQQLFPFKSKGNDYTAQGLSIAMHVFLLMNTTLFWGGGCFQVEAVLSVMKHSCR